MAEGTTQALEDRLRGLTVAPGTAACVWLGQAGYLFKSPAGVVVMVDPYLSDYAEEAWGVRRVVPAPIDPTRFRPDLLLVTHWHEDHFDVPVVKRWAREPDTILAGPVTCTARASAWGWPAERLVELSLGGTYRLGDVGVTATFARHEDVIAPAPEAFSALLDVGGVRIWDVADSEYDARLRAMREEAIDVAFVPINGVGGNMDAHEAALLMWHVRPKVAIPMHYDMWAPPDFGPGATLDPQTFVETYRRLGATGETRVLRVGEIVTFSS